MKYGQEKNWTYAKEVTHKKAGDAAVPVFNSFENMPEGPPKKKNYKNADGEIEVQYTFTTRPLSLGKTASSLVIAHPKRGAEHNGFYEYQGDDYGA